MPQFHATSYVPSHCASNLRFADDDVRVRAGCRCGCQYAGPSRSFAKRACLTPPNFAERQRGDPDQEPTADACSTA